MKGDRHMKCPYCGAETSNSVCEYCGSQIIVQNPQVRTTTCTKCGGNNVSYRRENQGEIKGKNTKQIVYRTVGYCKDCGNTWYIDNEVPIKKRKTWLWVLGWIFIFPVPLTILLLRNKKKKSGLKYGLIAAAWIVYLLIGFSGRTSNTSSTSTKTAPQNNSITTENAENSSNKVDEPVQSEETQSPAIIEEQDKSVAEKPEKEERTALMNDIPKEYRNALIKAEQYSLLMHMSKQGLYEQLTSEYGENFTEEAAQYAIDHVDADWNANALQKAKEYSDSMHMSKQGLFEQLTSEYGEQFTDEEAQYAIDHVDADWNANALEKAKTYQDSMAMSIAEIYDQLTSEYGEQFTEEEAQYAIDHLEE